MSYKFRLEKSKIGYSLEIIRNFEYVKSHPETHVFYLNEEELGNLAKVLKG